MLRLSFLMLVACVILMVPSAAQADEFVRQTTYDIPATTFKTTEVRKVAAAKPLVLPNITALSVRMWKTDRSALRPQLNRSKTVLNFWKNHKWILAPNQKKCWDVPWQRSCTAGRASYRLHTALATIAERRLIYELPNSNDWVTAVRIAQRVYPGTEGRIMRITDHEGGSGPWVWWSGTCSSPPCLWRGYHVGDDPWGADTVGGWVQFRYSTFIGYYPHMLNDLQRRGYIVPDLGWARPYVVAGASTGYGPWLSPLGQALTVAYMHYYGKQGSHWNF